MQGDRLNRGWRDQPTRATYKGRYRPHFAHVDDLLTRTRCFKCGELEHLARNSAQKKEHDPSLFNGDKETATESETFFSGTACDDFSTQAVFAEQEKMFLPDSNVDVRKETFLCYSNVEEKEETILLDSNVEDEKGTFLYDSNTDEKEETFVRNTMHEELEESSLYHPNVTLEYRGDIVPFSGSVSRVVCPQEYFAGVDHRGSLVNAGHFLFGPSLNLSVVDCVVRAVTTKLFPSGISEGCVMESDTDGNPHSKWCLCLRCIQSNEEASASRGASTAGAGGKDVLQRRYLSFLLTSAATAAKAPSWQGQEKE